MSNTEEKCAVDDKNRCLGITKDGQCRYPAVSGSRFCEFHDTHSKKRQTDESVARFLIEREELRKGYAKHTNHANYLDLRDAIGLLNMMIERRLNMATNQHEEIDAFRDVKEYMKDLQSMCISLMKLQQQMGLVLGKDELRIFAKEIGTVLNEELEDVPDKESRIDRICEKIYTSLESAGKKGE